MTRYRRLTLAVLVAGLVVVGDARARGSEPIRLSADIAGERAEVEVRDLPTEEATLAARQALGTLAAVERELAAGLPGSTVARLNGAAAGGAQAIDGGIAAMLETVLGFCVWSRNAHGPLGGVLYEAWERAERPPAPQSLQVGIRSAACDNLTPRPAEAEVVLAAGSRLDLRHFAAGYAVDRAMLDLEELGATNAFITYRSISRGSGGGPTGAGWKVTLPVFPGLTEAPDPVHLRDGALAVVSTHRRRFRFGTESFPAFLDQRSGRPSEGTVAVVTVTHRALDAQAIATAMVVLGNREGQLRLGGVIPSPSVLWLLGDGSGPPLLATFRWSELRWNQPLSPRQR